MQTKLQNWVIQNLVTEGWNLSYDELNESQLDRLIELAREAKEDLKKSTNQRLVTTEWLDVDFGLEEE